LIYVDMTHLVTNSHSLFYWLDCACVWVCGWKLATVCTVTFYFEAAGSISAGPAFIIFKHDA